MGAKRIDSRGQELYSKVGYSFLQVLAQHLPAEVGATRGELANLPAFLYLTSPLGPRSGCLNYQKDKGRSKGYGRTGNGKKYLNLPKSLRNGLKAQ